MTVAEYRASAETAKTGDAGRNWQKAGAFGRFGGQ